MGEIHFTVPGTGLTTTIHRDGSKTTQSDQWCDNCEQNKPAYGGLIIRDVSNEAVMWLCTQCRA